MHKQVSVRVLLIVVFLGMNLMVLFGWAVDYASTDRGDRLGAATRAALYVARFPPLVHRSFAQLFAEPPLLMPNPFPGLDGFSMDGRIQPGAQRDDGYLLQSAYDSAKSRSTVKLVRISDGSTLHEWKPDLAELASHQKKTVDGFFDSDKFDPRDYRILHPLLMDDGGLVVANEGPMFMINACSSLVKTVDGLFHHSKQADSEGNIWTSSVNEPAVLDARTFHAVRDDAVTSVSPAGKILSKRSVSRILIDNGYRGLLVGVGDYNKDLIHLNAVQPAMYTTKYWQKGDLMLSLRSLSTVLLYRPSTNKIIWLKTGPWLKQHNPQFIGDSRISVFGNNVIDSPNRQAAQFPDGANNIYIYNFEDGSVATPYTDVLKRAQVQTVTEGRVSILDNGDAVLEETNRGRTLRISPTAVIWQHTVTAPNHMISTGAWSTYLTSQQGAKLLATLRKTTCQ